MPSLRRIAALRSSVFTGTASTDLLSRFAPSSEKTREINRWRIACASTTAVHRRTWSVKKNKITAGLVSDLTRQAKPTKNDLSAQTLSLDPKERARQLDYQAQQSEEFQSGGDQNG